MSVLEIAGLQAQFYAVQYALRPVGMNQAGNFQDGHQAALRATK
jgi:hypothetical protein